MTLPILAPIPVHMQLGEGLLLYNTDLEACLAAEDPRAAFAAAAADPAHLIGATQAGCIFRCARTWLHTEARAQRTPTAASLLPGPWQVSLSGEMTAVTLENIARLLHASAFTSGSCTSLAFSTDPAAPESLLFLCETEDGLLIIELFSPVSTGGMQLNTRPQGTGRMPFTYTACQQDPDSILPPCRMLHLSDA